MTQKTSPLFSQKSSFAFVTSILATLCIGIFFPRLMAFLPSIIALFFGIVIYLQNKTFPIKNKKEFLFAGIFILLAFASSLWMNDPGFVIERAIKLVIIIIPSLLLLSLCTHVKTQSDKFILKFLIIILLISVSYLIFEQLSNHMIVRHFVDYYVIGAFLNRSYIIFALISLSCLFCIQQISMMKRNKIILFISVLFLSSYALILSISQTAQLTFLCGLIFLLFFPIASKNMGKVLFTGILALCFILPFLIKPMQNLIPQEMLLEGYLKEASIIYRLEVWNFTVTEIMKSPFYGHGLEAQRFMKADEWMVNQNSDSILHAHNVILQIWLEFGIIGILLGCVFLGYCYHKIFSQKNLQVRKLYLMLFVACFSCAMTGYGFWQSWQLGTFFIFTALSMMIAKTQLEKAKSL